MTVEELEKLRGLEEKLLTYAQLEGTELGEYCMLLCEFSRFTYMFAPGFQKALEKELLAQLSNFMNCSEIVTATREVPAHTETITELEWKE